ncbi:proteasome 20S subunit beta 12 [Rhinichthys klamathensis goyatoka]|uniref:proteasome 20S subunit beta 12 n=1 Tax=Rhinichthys klamathensis goyatoka TaxID=3034132 RepID=UPI0024B4B5EF|nr:proteasome 20S subunit beta 12 [Rhinichthys klamathensis goyatoka]
MSEMGINGEWRSSKVSTGTTIIAVRYDGGVVIGSDSRASMGEEYVSSRVINKVIQIHDQIFCCMAGSLADAQAVTNAVIHQLGFHSMQMEEPPLVQSAAAIMKSFCYTHRDELSAGFIVAGWDRKRGPQVFQVSLGGMIVEQEFTIGGSGGTYIYGYADAKFKPGMTREECLTFTTNALSLAMDRDNVSGGVVHLAIVTEKGAERQLIPGNKLPVLQRLA